MIAKFLLGNHIRRFLIVLHALWYSSGNGRNNYRRRKFIIDASHTTQQIRPHVVLRTAGTAQTKPGINDLQSHPMQPPTDPIMADPVPQPVPPSRHSFHPIIRRTGILFVHQMHHRHIRYLLFAPLLIQRAAMIAQQSTLDANAQWTAVTFNHRPTLREG